MPEGEFDPNSELAQEWANEFKMLPHETLAEVIEPRIEELYTLVQSELRRSGYEDPTRTACCRTGAR